MTDWEMTTISESHLKIATGSTRCEYCPRNVTARKTIAKLVDWLLPKGPAARRNGYHLRGLS